jgi:hypothetical protein
MESGDNQPRVPRAPPAPAGMTMGNGARPPSPSTPGPDMQRIGQRVKVPWRLVASAHYPDVALSVYVKIKALALRPEGCTAAATTIARYLGLSKASVERGIGHLRRPAPDGVVELPENTRRSLPGGHGTTARRRVRALQSTERFVWLPVMACEDLTPRQLRAYAVLAFAQEQHIALSLSDLAGFLRHRRGRRAGQPITAAAAARVIDDLEAARWVTVLRRAGAQGRHRFLVQHRSPAAVATEPPSSTENRTADWAAGTSSTTSVLVGEGSGSACGDVSLTDKESPKTDRPENAGRRPSPAVGEIPVVGATGAEGGPDGAMQPTRPHGRALRARAGHPPADRAPDAPSSGTSKGSPPSYSGPPLTLSPQIYAVLEPVHWLLAQISNVFVVRQIAREVGRQLRNGTEPNRLRARLQMRFAHTSPAEIRDPGRWLLGVALPRWGCGLIDCESGVLWTSGRWCAVCREIAADRLRLPQPTADAPTRHSGWLSTVGMAGSRGGESAMLAAGARRPHGAPRGNCGECGCRILLTGSALADGLCKPCREERLPQRAEASSPAVGQSESCSPAAAVCRSRQHQ